MKLKIFLLIMFSLGFFVIGSRSVKSADSIGTCYCDIETQSQSILREVTPFVQADCVNKNEGTPNIDEVIYTQCAWVDSSKGICKCDFTSKPEDGVLPITFSGIVDIPVIHCKAKSWDAAEGFYKNCKYESPPPVGSGCYCSFYYLNDTLIPGFSNIKVAVAKESECKEEDSSVMKRKDCVWKGQPPPTKTPTESSGSSGSSSGGTSATVQPTAPPISAKDAKPMGQDASKNAKFVRLDNPLGQTDIRVILGNLITKAMGILGSVTLMVFVYGGFMWLISGGNAEKIKKGSQTMMWAVVGLFLIFGSYAIMGLVLEGIGAKQQKGDISGNLFNISKQEGVSVADVVRGEEGCYCKVFDKMPNGQPEYLNGGKKELIQGIEKTRCETMATQGPAWLGEVGKTGTGECEWKTFQSVPGAGTETTPPASTPPAPPPVAKSCKIKTDAELNALCRGVECRESTGQNIGKCKEDCGLFCENKDLCVKQSTITDETKKICTDADGATCLQLTWCKWE